jgi:hypothetical protein
MLNALHSNSSTKKKKKNLNKKISEPGVVIPGLKRQKQVDCEFQSSLDYIMTSRPMWATW